MSKIISLILILSLPLPSQAGDLMKKGEVLKEDSYVFALGDAKSLALRMAELERAEVARDKYRKLYLIQEEQIKLYEINIENLKSQKKSLQEIVAMDKKIIAKYKKKDDFLKYERGGVFLLGVVVTAGAVYLAGMLAPGAG